MTRPTQLADLIRFVHFRRDGSWWIIDLEMEIGDKWMGWSMHKTKRAALQSLKAVIGYDVQFGSDKSVGWF